jgi:hypothetical protein
VKRLSLLLLLAIAPAFADSIAQPLGPVTALAGTGTTALQCIFTNNAGTLSIACTINGAAAYTGTMTPVAIPNGTTGAIASYAANGNTITWVITPTVTPNLYNWSVTANTQAKTGQI